MRPAGYTQARRDFLLLTPLMKKGRRLFSLRPGGYSLPGYLVEVLFGVFGAALRIGVDHVPGDAGVLVVLAAVLRDRYKGTADETVEEIVDVAVLVNLRQVAVEHGHEDLVELAALGDHELLLGLVDPVELVATLAQDVGDLVVGVVLVAQVSHEVEARPGQFRPVGDYTAQVLALDDLKGHLRLRSVHAFVYFG